MIKIILLIVFIVALTWYSHQEENNPFSVKEKVRVFLIDGKPVVACYPRYPKKEPLTIIVTDNQVPCLGIIEKAKSWALICGYDPVDPCSIQPAPQIWTTLSDTKSVSIQGWPQPYPAHSIKDTLNISAKIIPFPSERSSALLFQTANYSGLIIGNGLRTDPIILESFKERLDLLIVCDQNPSTIKSLRSKIRPRFLISTSQPDEELKKLSNILFLKNSFSGLEFKVQNLKKLILSS
ncbi:MAG: hypothetical protein GX267_17230 [Fibrobacter sp.]|nr:hypothetical protein [Fibrobacter sp.]